MPCLSIVFLKRLILFSVSISLFLTVFDKKGCMGVCVCVSTRFFTEGRLEEVVEGMGLGSDKSWFESCPPTQLF